MILLCVLVVILLAIKLTLNPRIDRTSGGIYLLFYNCGRNKRTFIKLN